MIYKLFALKSLFQLRLKLIFLFSKFHKFYNLEITIVVLYKDSEIYIIWQVFHIRIKLYEHQFTKQISFCEILEFVLLS